MDDELEFTTRSQSSDTPPHFNHGRGEIAPGTMIAGRYKVKQKIGEGGMAVVYLIEQIFLKETLALKVLTTGLSDTSTVRFQKEAQVCRMLDHPNLIRVIDFALLDNDSPYLVMEFINGESLADILKRRGQLTESEAIDIFLQIMDGLAYAHEQKVIHRDLKPSNVMLFQRADKQLQVKILDFGIAKITGKDTLNTMTLTGTGEIFGSPLFMSPEQCLGRTVDSRSDLYSIGCALYQVLTGAPPFAGESALSTMMMHLENEPLPLGEASLGKTFSPAIEKLTMKLLAKLPDDRYQTARDVFEDLEAIKERRAPRESRAKTQPGSGDSKETKVSPAVLIMIAVCVILAAGSIAVLTLKHTNSPNSELSSVEGSKAIAGPSASDSGSGKGLPQRPFSFFSTIPRKDWKGGPWVFDFPPKEIGRIGIANFHYELVPKDLPPQVARNQIALGKASPLCFSTYMTDIDADELSRFRPDEIEQLKFLDAEVHDDAVTKIELYQGLKYLYLNNCFSLTNNCLQSIAKIPNLVSLRVNNPSFDMAQLGRMVASSNIKIFAGRELEGADDLCREIFKAKNVTDLTLEDDPDLTDAGVAELSNMTNLEALRLADDPKITNVGVSTLSNLKHLKSVNFEKTNLTADIIPALKKFPHKCQIVLDLEKWTESDRALFAKELPRNLVP